MSAVKKRDIFVVDEAFQFKYSIFLGVSGLIISLLISFVVYNYSLAHDRILLVSGLDQSSEIVSFFSVQQRLLLVKLVALSVIITLFMFLVGLIVSNRIAGPVFSIRRKIREIISSGDYSTRFYVRKRDELKDLVQELNLLMEKIEQGKGADAD
ncbi:MAG: hypothetical protein JXA66_09455 [Oligoflexia bacterium]|nr:hypothetical protein [Oligoflexia bacterium]